MSKEAMKLALEALEMIAKTEYHIETPPIESLEEKMRHIARKVIPALREALAEQPARPYRLLQDNGSKYFGDSWDKAEQPAPAQQCMDHGECFGGKCIYPAPQPAQQEPVEVPTTSYEHRKFVLVGREWYERFAAFHDDCQIGEQLTWQEKTIRQQGYENGWNDAQRYLREPQASPPAQRTWVGLTYEEAKEIYTCIHGYDSSKRIARAIEAKLKEKNT